MVVAISHPSVTRLSDNNYRTVLDTPPDTSTNHHDQTNRAIAITVYGIASGAITMMLVSLIHQLDRQTSFSTTSASADARTHTSADARSPYCASTLCVITSFIAAAITLYGCLMGQQGKRHDGEITELTPLLSGQKIA